MHAFIYFCSRHTFSFSVKQFADRIGEEVGLYCIKYNRLWKGVVFHRVEVL